MSGTSGYHGNGTLTAISPQICNFCVPTNDNRFMILNTIKRVLSWDFREQHYLVSAVATRNTASERF